MTDAAYTAYSAMKNTLQTILGSNALYARLKENSKVPDGSFKPGRKNRHLTPPETTTYGVIPQKRLFILDIDNHDKNAWNIDKQIDFFSELFEVNLRESLAVVTQTGGIHIYLYFPETMTLKYLSQCVPKASLRGFNKVLSKIYDKEILLDSDIRSSFTNGYVVGPGSRIDMSNDDKRSQRFKGYIYANESFGFKTTTLENREVLTISENAVEKLKYMVEAKNSHESKAEQQTGTAVDKTSHVLNALKTHSQKIGSDTPDTIASVDNGVQTENHVEKNTQVVSADDQLLNELNHNKPSAETLNKISFMLRKRNINAFHRARAIVKSYLHCCYDDYAIVMSCIDLGIDKDSYREGSLGTRELLHDIGRFTPQKKFHSKYCGHISIKKQPTRKYDGENLSDDEYKAQVQKRNSQKIADKRAAENKGSFYLSPRVLDMGKISKALIGDSRKKKVSQQYFDALNIVNYYIQPLSNVGTARIMLAHSNISDVLHINSGRVRQAMRVLRDKGIINIAQRQTTGMAATYSVSLAYENKFLTQALRLAWGKYNSDTNRYHTPMPIYFNFVEGHFKTVFGDEIVEPVSDFSSWIISMTSDFPDDAIEKMENYHAGAAARYLVAQRESIIDEKEHEESSVHETNEHGSETSFEHDDETLDSVVDDEMIVNPQTGEILSSDSGRDNEIPIDDDERNDERNDMSCTTGDMIADIFADDFEKHSAVLKIYDYIPDF